MAVLLAEPGHGCDRPSLRGPAGPDHALRRRFVLGGDQVDGPSREMVISGIRSRPTQEYRAVPPVAAHPFRRRRLIPRGEPSAFLDEVTIGDRGEVLE